MAAMAVFLVLQSPAILAGQPQEKARAEERQERFRQWLEEDVAYIVTPEEKDVFRRLTTDDEREKFIEQFWDRRNPNPLSSENSFKSEHYRRIAYANDHFASGRPGWKTDRGRIYILFGKPDEVKTSPTGDRISRDIKDGGGSTTTCPYETWFYRHLDGIGDGIEIEFVDSGLSGEYRMAISPDEKDALLFASGTGSTLLEQMGYETRNDRIRNLGMRDVAGASMFRYGELNHAFDRYQRFFQLRRPPEIQFRDLQQMVTTRIGFGLLPMDLGWSYVQLGADRFMAPLTVSIPNSALTFSGDSDPLKAKVEIYGVVSSLSGRVVYEFEDTLVTERTKAVLSGSRPGKSLYQRAIPLFPGHFKLTLVVRDPATGKTAILDHSLSIPRPPEKGPWAGNLIVADGAAPAARGEVLTDPFVVEGSLKLYPNVTGQVRNGTSITGYVEVYNLSVDPKSLRPDWEVEIRLLQEGKEISLPADTISRVFPIFRGEKLALIWTQTIRVSQPGPYSLRVTVLDRVGGGKTSSSAQIRVF